MADFVKVARVSEVAEGTGKVVSAHGEEIALFHVNGNFYAVHNTCLHRGGPLGEGTVDGTTVTCPWHGWEYDVTTGKSLTNPSAQVRRFQVKVEGEDVLVSP